MVIFFVPMTAIDFYTKTPNNFFVQKLNYFIKNTSILTQNSIELTIGLILFIISLMIWIHIYNNKEF